MSQHGKNDKEAAMGRPGEKPLGPWEQPGQMPCDRELSTKGEQHSCSLQSQIKELGAEELGQKKPGHG